MRSGSRLRKDCVGFPGNFLSVTLGVVLEVAHRLDDVDAPTALTGRELGAPDRGVESCAEVDVVHHSAGLKVRLLPGHQQLAYREVCLCSVEVHARLVHLERHRLTQGGHPAMLATSTSRADSDASRKAAPAGLILWGRVRRLRQTASSAEPWFRWNSSTPESTSRSLMRGESLVRSDARQSPDRLVLSGMSRPPGLCLERQSRSCPACADGRIPRRALVG